LPGQEPGNFVSTSQRALQHDEENKEEKLFERALRINEAQSANLRKSGWLGDFEPMLMSCPLTARKVSQEAVPEFAALVWRCDGLGFAWECSQEYKCAGHTLDGCGARQLFTQVRKAAFGREGRRRAGE
jgi:hypothetical protein